MTIIDRMINLWFFNNLLVAVQVITSVQAMGIMTTVSQAKWQSSTLTRREA
jgi:hypothetical protein